MGCVKFIYCTTVRMLDALFIYLIWQRQRDDEMGITTPLHCPWVSFWSVGGGGFHEGCSSTHKATQKCFQLQIAMESKV